MRLNRYLARAGVASRRKSEMYIRDGRVRVNGEPVFQPFVQVDPHRDAVWLDGQSVEMAEDRLYRYYKPRGIVSTVSDPRGRPDLSNVRDRLGEAFVPVGRLDRDSEGLLLWTNNGTWVQALTHPTYGAAKRYRVTVAGHLGRETATTLAQQTELPDGTHLAYAPRVYEVRPGRRKSVLEVELREGKRRQLRELVGALGYEVRRLIRVWEAGIDVAGLRPGDIAQVQGKALERFRKELARCWDGANGV